MPNTFSHLGHTLTWEEHHPGEHTFIFINGFSGVRVGWARWLDYFKAFGRCVTVDLPGHYPAQAPTPYTQLTQTDLIALEVGAVQAMCGTRSATVIGHSTGGLVALGVAARLPQVQRVIAFAPVVWGPLTGFLGAAQRLLRQTWAYPIFWLQFRPTQLSEAMLLQGMLFYARHPRDFRRDPHALAFCRTSYPVYRQLVIWNLAVLLRCLDACDLRPTLAGYRTPTLVLHGAQDRIVPVAQAQWLSQHLTCVEKPELPEADHFLLIEDFEATSSAISSWLGQHPLR